MEKNHAILLVRVSTLEQDYQAQILDLTKYGKSLGYTDFHIVQTKETAFADLHQKVGTNEMFKFIEENPLYNTVLTTEISRLARRQSILHSIKEHCLSKQIQIYIKDLDFKLLDNDGKINQQAEIVFTLFGLFAESEVKQKLERFSRKRKELMQQGLSITGKLLFGYDRFLLPEIGKNTLIINEEQSTIVRTIYNWYLNGLDNIKNPSIKRISLECVKRGYHPYTHSKRNVNKLLKEQGYTGEKTTKNKRKNPKFGLVLGETEYIISTSKIKYPVIIEHEIYDKVQLKLKSNIINSDKETKHITLLAKLLICPSCGCSLQGNYRIRSGTSINSYRCTSRSKTIPCTSTGKSLAMNLIDSAVWSIIKKDFSALSKKINEINPNIYLLELENHLANLIKREKQIQIDINENIAILNSVGKLTNTNVIKLIQKTGKVIQKLESEFNEIQQEKSLIESNKLLINDKQDNVELVINENIEKIESSKELLKKYINLFIEKINIFQHNQRYTILQLIMKDSSTFALLSNPEYYSQRHGKNIEVIHIIIDKKITQKPKIAFSKSSGQVDLEFHKKIVIPDYVLPKVKNWYELKKLKI